jgi:hypothetical protein
VKTTPYPFDSQELFVGKRQGQIRLFLQRRQLDLGLLSPDDTQRHKHQKKKYEYDEMGIGSLLRSQWTSLSKVTRQVWRFLKNCFAQIHDLALYRRQLAPLLRGYI